MKKYLEEILIALSLSNLLFIVGWRRLIYPTSHSYHIKFAPSYLDHLSLLLLVVLTATVFFCGFQLVRYLCGGRTPWVVKSIFLLILFCALNAARIAFYEHQKTFTEAAGRTTLFMIAAILGVLFIAAVLKWRGKIFSFARVAVLMLSPFVFITFSQAVWGALTAEPEPQESFVSQPAAAPASPKNDVRSRVVWFVFDEMDYKLSFENRPPEVDMPEFDRFLQQSLTATQAVSPSNATLESMASLLSGRQVEEAKPYSKTELILYFSDGQQSGLSETPTVFSAVKNMGGRSAVAGWYHSYCRVIGKDLSDCHWEGFDLANDFHSQSFSQSLVRDLYIFSLSIPGGYRIVKLIKGHWTLKAFTEYNERYVKRHENLIEASKRMVPNPELDLVLIHLPIPHYPNFYNRTKQDYSGGSGYVDNLIFTDLVFGGLRRDMEAAGLWDDSVVIVSADHPWRLEIFTDRDRELAEQGKDPRVPFIVKLKNQTGPVKYEKPFNTLVTHDLILALMKGEISTPGELEKWLDLRAGN
jgi:hypothetical protein